jgi:serine/threonine protein kinase
VREFEQEVDMMKNLVHPNIVRYYGTSREEHFLNIFLEYVTMHNRLVPLCAHTHTHTYGYLNPTAYSVLVLIFCLRDR